MGKPQTRSMHVTVPKEWLEALLRQVPNVSEYVRNAVNEQIKRDGLDPLPGHIVRNGVPLKYIKPE